LYVVVIGRDYDAEGEFPFICLEVVESVETGVLFEFFCPLKLIEGCVVLDGVFY
jgi:hypothetical protein